MPASPLLTGVRCLSLVSLAGIGAMAVCAIWTGDIPPALAAVSGASIGALQGLLTTSQKPGGGDGK